MPTKAAFLDLNGTIVMPVQVRHPTEHWIIPGAIDAVRVLNQQGFLYPVVTVQTRIAKGYFSVEDFAAWFQDVVGRFRAAGAVLCGPYVCPHWPPESCICSKPQPYLYRQAAVEHNISLAQSVIIGDTAGDIQAAKTLGCMGCLVRTGWGEAALQGAGVGQDADHIAADVLAAAQWIVQRPVVA
jgi:D-glycero-D-manno-heptose 1,7-bisphosphate phosphatase